MPTLSDPAQLTAPVVQSFSTTRDTADLESVLSSIGAKADDVRFFSEDVSAPEVVDAADAQAALGEGIVDPDAGDKNAGQILTAAPAVPALPTVATPTDPAALPTKDERKAHIEAKSAVAKAQRIAAQQLAQARQLEHQSAQQVAKANAFEAAIGDWRKDPTALIRAAGLTEAEYFQAAAQHALAAADAPPPDPVQTAVESRMAPYIAEQQRLQAEIAARDMAIAESNAIAKKVLPPILAEPDKYETLVALHGGDTNAAAIYVYTKMKEYHAATGITMDPAEAAAELEEKHFQHELGVVREAQKRKKMRGEFGVPSEVPAGAAALAKPAAVVAKPAASPTLTAASGLKVMPVTNARGQGNRVVTARTTSRTGDADLDEVLNKYAGRL